MEIRDDSYGASRYRIYTNTGEVPVFNNDYIIKGVNGEFYPCNSEVFEKTYEEVEA